MVEAVTVTVVSRSSCCEVINNMCVAHCCCCSVVVVVVVATAVRYWKMNMGSVEHMLLYRYTRCRSEIKLERLCSIICTRLAHCPECFVFIYSKYVHIYEVMNTQGDHHCCGLHALDRS